MKVFVHTAIYGADIRFWPTLIISSLAILVLCRLCPPGKPKETPRAPKVAWQLIAQSWKRIGTAMKKRNR
jgi:hypothetical protein